ncbi:MAG: replication-relaxation family protein [Acidimicrobiales bacterium]
MVLGAAVCRALWADRPPGCYAARAEDGRRVEFFFEYDIGTESLGRLVDKLDGYADLAIAGGPAIPVLFWLQTTAREADPSSPPQ